MKFLFTDMRSFLLHMDINSLLSPWGRVEPEAAGWLTIMAVIYSLSEVFSSRYELGLHSIGWIWKAFEWRGNETHLS